ncbi:MAG: PD-(D/E)XK nuclease family protein [Cyclobacteriaceae bacterium]|nr:PD-(D/E)XK nuclease family protein [Cyclobacteriaceae bacterium]
MKFLEEIVELVLKKYGHATDQLTIVFPNRRAGLFFRKYLSAKIDRPLWSPQIISIEDFIKNLSPLQTADKLELIFELYQVFVRHNHSDEGFDRFYFWGNILLQDFDELDSFMVDAALLFKNLMHVKQMENSLDFLKEDQLKLITEFWASFGDKLSSHQKGFLGVWDNLHQTYIDFKTTLQQKGIGYNGMIYRQVAEMLEKSSLAELRESKTIDGSRVVFAGFNALSASEERIVSWFVGEGVAEVHWDADDYYLNDRKQEAGNYLREMKYGNPILKESFKASYGNAFAKADKKIEVLSVASEVGQAQQVTSLLTSKNIKLNEETAVILPNNTLLLPLLHALPGQVQRLNITMGYPLTSSLVYSFVDAIIELHLRSENKSAYHFRAVLTILRHPLLGQRSDGEIEKIAGDILQQNTIWVPKHKLQMEHALLGRIFTDPSPGLPAYLLELVRFLAAENEDEFEKEFYYRFYLLLNRLNEFVALHQLHIATSAFQKLFRQMAQNERMPFEGEPLLGLQVMGMLETRNIDFDTVIMLSMNERMVPPAAKNSSFIPYSIRKVFGLPVADHQDSMYAYLFYRLVQRAHNIYLIYNATEETGKSGEVSRFVRQLQHETSIPISFGTIATEVSIEDPHHITVYKNDRIMESLYRFTSVKGFLKRFTPTALSAYLDCRLRFYFKYVLELSEPEEVAEEVDAMVFGNILHKVLEQLYLPFDREGYRTVNPGDFAKLKKRIDDEITSAFATQFGSDVASYVFEGQNILAREIIGKMILKVLEYDARRAPFEILGLEADQRKGYVLDIEIQIEGKSAKAGMKGVIDRIESKDGIVRITDYKTGQDNNSFADISGLFDRENKSRNKAIFQTFFYALLYLESPMGRPDLPVQAALFAVRELFKEGFSPLIVKKEGRMTHEVDDVRVHLEEFRGELKDLLQEILDPSVPFSQTEDLRKCSYCPYAGICNR